MQSTETWKPVLGYEGVYEVSDHGRVRTIRRKIIRSNGRPHTIPERILNDAPLPKGHRRVGLTLGNRLRTHTVHKLVLEAFVGPAPDGMMCRHLNGNPADNRLDNLRWGTGSENQNDAVKHGAHYLASKPNCKRGHPLSGKNLRLIGGKSRQCIACTRESENARTQGRTFSPGLADERYRDVVSQRSRSNGFTEAEVREIRHRFNNGESQGSIGRSMGRNQVTISDIVRRKTWKHID